MNNPDGLVDYATVESLFADLDEDTKRLLRDAAEKDITQWGDRLIASWVGNDLELRMRAQHSLTGVCANFGATALLKLSNDDLSTNAAREAFNQCRDATFAALAEAARG